MTCLARIVRRADLWASRVRAAIRLRWLRLKYPRLTIAGRVFISPGCSIVCTDAGQMQLSNVHVGRGATLVADNGGLLEISDTSIGPYSTVVACEHISIAPGCAIAARRGSHVCVLTIDHPVWLLNTTKSPSDPPNGFPRRARPTANGCRRENRKLVWLRFTHDGELQLVE